ncbi:hypothetical protein [Kordia zhangzhouensis]|uniref:hypothetical protein n=1 Tax=Kordia zhangzhouensis TaxID=1620405 RepID=UPI00062954E9|nr:hypothetical protein [Kordia zhangzhouensis]
MKTFLTILLFSVSTCVLLAHTSKRKNSTAYDAEVTFMSAKSTNAAVISSPTIESPIESGGLNADKGDLNSILGYSILIFFSVLIIILIDNRNLEKRYKKLLSDFKNKDSIL